MGALDILQKQGKKAAALSFPWIYPFPVDATKQFLGKAKRIIVVEQNATGQLAWLLRAEAGIDVTDTFLKYDGRPWFPEEVIEKL